VTVAASIGTSTSEGTPESEKGHALWHQLRRQIGIRELGSGQWFTRLANAYLRHRSALGQVNVAVSPTDRSGRANQIIRRGSLEAMLAGSVTAAISTSASVTLAETQWVAGLAGVPLVGVALTAETMLRGLVGLKVACDLGDLYGIRFDSDDAGEIARLCALAFRTEQDEGNGDLGQTLIERLARLEGHEATGAVGLKMLGESIIRNAVPFVGIVVSTLANWQQARHVGQTVRSYVRLRRALDDAIAAAEKDWSEVLDVLIEGIWFVFIAKGRLAPEEVAILARLVRHQGATASRSQSLTARLVQDESDWLRRLDAVPKDARVSVLHVLEVAACADQAVPPAEEAVLERAARALHGSLDHNRLEGMLRQFNATEALEPGVPGVMS
jgi:hypothetical protein